MHSCPPICLQYVLHQFLHMLGKDEAVILQLPMLKSKSKIREHDKLYGLLCTELGWSYKALAK